MFQTLFLNLPVENVQRSVAFFESLGFKLNPQFTDENTACVIASDSVFVMLSVRDKFLNFIDKKIAPADTTEAILSFACASKEEVTAISEKAFAAGARRVNDPEDHGFMFSWGFEDLDGHLWDLFWMNPEHVR